MGSPDGVWLEYHGSSLKAIEDGELIGRFRWNSGPDPNMNFSFLCEISFSDGKRLEQISTIADWIFQSVVRVRYELHPFVLR